MIRILIVLSVLTTVACYAFLIAKAGSKRAKLLWIALLYFPVVGITIITLTSPRLQDADVESRYMAAQTVSGAVWQLAGRYTTLGLLLLSAMCMVLGFYRRRGAIPQGSALWMALMLYSGSVVLSSFFGAALSFHVGLLIVPIIFSAFWLLPIVDPTWVMGQLRNVLGLFVYASAIASLVAPEWALQTTYHSQLLPVNLPRLYGMTAHANILGAIAALFLTFQWLVPGSGGGQRIHTIVGLLVVLATQSKTAMVIVLCVGLVRVFYWARFSKRRGVVRTATLWGSAFAVILLTIVSTVLISDKEGVDGGLSTFTGRTTVWHITYETWKEYPVFGYGPTIWSLEFRQEKGERLLWAGHAHNQFVQALGEAGVVGVVTFMLYLSVLIYYAIKFGRATRGASMGLLVFFVLRTVTEASIRNYAPDHSLLVHIVVFVSFLALIRADHCSKAVSIVPGAVRRSTSPALI
jgi:O-antigen ligase